MGFSDRLKGIRDQAQQAVGGHRDQIQGAVHGIGEAANKRTHGKYADKISKFDTKAAQAVDKLGGSNGKDGASAAGAAAQTPSAGETPAAADAAATDTREAAQASTPAGEPPAFDN